MIKQMNEEGTNRQTSWGTNKVRNRKTSKQIHRQTKYEVDKQQTQLSMYVLISRNSRARFAFACHVVPKSKQNSNYLSQSKAARTHRVGNLAGRLGRTALTTGGLTHSARSNPGSARWSSTISPSSVWWEGHRMHRETQTINPQRPKGKKARHVLREQQEERKSKKLQKNLRGTKEARRGADSVELLEKNRKRKIRPTDWWLLWHTHPRLVWTKTVLWGCTAFQTWKLP